MVAVRQIGYLSGCAVALGIGAAIASQGTAHADSTQADSSAKTADASASTGVNAGPKRSVGASDTSRPKPLSKIRDNIDGVAAQANTTVTSATHKITTSIGESTQSIKPVAKPKPKPSPEGFEAQQVERLKNLYLPKQAATAPVPTAATTTTSTADVTAERDPNPFRADGEPDPTDMPKAVLDAEDALLERTPEAVRPYVREGYEASYRFSQMVPYVNAPIPILQIIMVLPGLLQSDAAAKDSAQFIVNQLLLTTPPVSFLYYGYDEVADLLNVEEEAQAKKEDFYATAWDTLDPLFLLHNTGNPGIDPDPPSGPATVVARPLG
jgi:hypothetical protein